MYTTLRGPMHPSMRIGVLVFFAVVYAPMALSICIGIPLRGARTAVVFNQHAPNAEDRRIARELRDRADAQGVELDVSAVEIAQARRLGQLDVIQEVADLQLSERPPRDDAPRTRMEGAYYRDDLEQTEAQADGSSWLWALGAAGTLFLSLMAGAAAILSLVWRSPSRDALDPTDARL